MYKACLFDLDGTLLDTVESIAHIANQVLAYYHLPSHPVEAYNYFAGDGADVLMERSIRAAGGDLACLDEARKMYRSMFAKDPLYHVTAYEGMTQTLQTLKSRGGEAGCVHQQTASGGVGRHLRRLWEGTVRYDPGAGAGDRKKTVAPVRAADRRPSGCAARRLYVCGRYGHGYDHRACGGHVYHRGAVGLSGPQGTGGKSCAENYRTSV